MRRSVDALMVVMVRRAFEAQGPSVQKQDHGFPHVLVLQVANAFFKL